MLPKDLQFSYDNYKNAQALSRYRPFLPSFFYPDFKGGAIDPKTSYWYKYGVLNKDNFNVRYRPLNDWVYVSYKNSSNLRGFDTRPDTIRTLNFRFNKLDNKTYLSCLSVASAYQEYIGARLQYSVNSSRLLGTIEFLKLELIMQKNKLG